MGCFLLLGIFCGLLTQGFGLSINMCPISCECEKKGQNVTRKVECLSGYWNYLPTIPPSTDTLLVTNGNFSILRSPSQDDCWRFQLMDVLFLNKNHINQIDSRAFNCMHQMTKLSIKANDITLVTPGTLSPLRKLTVLELSFNKLTPEVFKEIGELKQLKILNVASNKMKISKGMLDFMTGSLQRGSLDISKNSVHGNVCDVIKPLQNVSVLIMKKCNISSLDFDTFEGFDHLSVLTLAGNKLKEISPFVFTNLTKLAILALSNCFDGARLDWLSFLPRVITLSIDSNKLTYIPKVVDSVTMLNLANNRIVTIGPDSFIGLKQLKQLNIYRCHLTSIHKNAFRGLPLLRKILLQNNVLNETAFANLSHGLANSSLVSLSLGGSHIHRLTKSTFEGFTPNILKRLYLHGGEIQTISPYSFENFHHLQLLDLGSNRITSIDKDAFTGLLALDHLDLNDNHLTRFYGFGDGGPTDLTVLDLDYNNIHSFEYGTLIGFRSLKVLRLKRNSLTNIPRRFFETTPNLESITLSENRIGTLQPESFMHMKNLTSVIMLKNSITPKDIILSGLATNPNLQYLDLAYNTAIGTDLNALKTILQKLCKLQMVVLARCTISSLLPDMFSSNVELTHVILPFNVLSQLEPTAFRNASSLVTLILVGNRIRFLTYETFTYLPALRELQLSDNPLLCTCELLFIIQAVRSNMLYMGKNGLAGMRCDLPKKVKGLSLQQLDLAVTDCEGSWLAMLYPMTGCIGGVIAVFGVMYFWRIRWHLRYLAFIVRAGRRRYREIREEAEYTYDAFLAYSEKDLHWIKEHLLPHLDETIVGEDGFSFCIHHRDWLVGVDIVDNIVNSIEQSRRTIILLSNNFASSQWCQYELAMAQLKLDADGTTRNLLVIVLLDKISPEYLTPRLRFILTSKTYLSWSEEPEGQRLFWKALKRSLSRDIM